MTAGSKPVQGGEAKRRVCATCGRTASPAARFCGGCGQPLGGSEAAAATESMDLADNAIGQGGDGQVRPLASDNGPIGKRVNLVKPPLPPRTKAIPPAPPPTGAKSPTPPSTNPIERRPAWLLGLLALCIVLAATFLAYFAVGQNKDAATTPGTAAPAATDEEVEVSDNGVVGEEMTKYVVATAAIRDRARNNSLVTGQLTAGLQVRGTMVLATDGPGFWFRLRDGRGYVAADQLSDGQPLPASPIEPSEPAVIIQPIPTSPEPTFVAPRDPAPQPLPSPAARSSAGSGPISSGRGPTFSCARASTYVEQTICGDPRLAALERRMVALYGQVRSNPQQRQQVLSDQRMFLADLTQCEDRQCLQQMYEDRISELAGY